MSGTRRAADGARPRTRGATGGRGAKHAPPGAPVSAAPLGGPAEEMRYRLTRIESDVAALRAGPVDAFVKQVVEQLEQGPWGELLTELHRLGADEGAEPPDVKELLGQVTMLRLALFSALGIRPYPSAKRVRLTPARAQMCRWAGDQPLPRGGRGWYEVVSPGWKRGGTVLLPPRIAPATAAGRAEGGTPASP